MSDFEAAFVSSCESLQDLYSWTQVSCCLLHTMPSTHIYGFDGVRPRITPWLQRFLSLWGVKFLTMLVPLKLCFLGLQFCLPAFLQNLGPQKLHIIIISPLYVLHFRLKHFWIFSLFNTFPTCYCYLPQPGSAFTVFRVCRQGPFFLFKSSRTKLFSRKCDSSSLSNHQYTYNVICLSKCGASRCGVQQPFLAGFGWKS